MFGCEGKTDRRHGEDRCDETHRELLVTGCMGHRQTKPCKRLANICQQVCLGFTIRTETWRQVGTLGWSDRTSNSPNTSALPVTRSVSHQSSTAFPHLTFFSCSLTPILSPHALALYLILNISRRPLERVSKSPWQQKDCEKKEDRGREP